MGFSCDCDTYNDFSSLRTVKAKKEHRCCECGHVIKPGEEYEYASGKCEGDFWDAKTCERCADLRSSFSALGYCVTIGGGLFDDYADWLDEQPCPAGMVNEDGDFMRGYERARIVRDRHRNWSAVEAA